MPKLEDVINKPLALEFLKRLEALDTSADNARERTLATVAWVLTYAVTSSTPNEAAAERVLAFLYDYMKENEPFIRKYLAEATSTN